MGFFLSLNFVDIFVKLLFCKLLAFVVQLIVSFYAVCFMSHCSVLLDVWSFLLL